MDIFGKGSPPIEIELISNFYLDVKDVTFKTLNPSILSHF